MRGKNILPATLTVTRIRGDASNRAVFLQAILRQVVDSTEIHPPVRGVCLLRTTAAIMSAGRLCDAPHSPGTPRGTWLRQSSMAFRMSSTLAAVRKASFRPFTCPMVLPYQLIRLRMQCSTCASSW